MIVLNSKLLVICVTPGVSGTSEMKLSSSPASNSNTFQLRCSDSRLAITEPPDPEPITMKSYSEKYWLVSGIELLNWFVRSYSNLNTASSAPKTEPKVSQAMSISEMMWHIFGDSFPNLILHDGTLWESVWIAFTFLWGLLNADALQKLSDAARCVNEFWWSSLCGKTIRCANWKEARYVCGCGEELFYEYVIVSGFMISDSF